MPLLELGLVCPKLIVLLEVQTPFRSNSLLSIVPLFSFCGGLFSSTSWLFTLNRANSISVVALLGMNRSPGVRDCLLDLGDPVEERSFVFLTPVVGVRKDLGFLVGVLNSKRVGVLVLIVLCFRQTASRNSVKYIPSSVVEDRACEYKDAIVIVTRPHEYHVRNKSHVGVVLTMSSTSSITCTIHGGRDCVQVHRSLEVKADHTGYLSALSTQLSSLQSDVNKTLSDLVDKEKAVVGGANGLGTRGKDSEGILIHIHVFSRLIHLMVYNIIIMFVHATADELDGNSDEDDNHTSGNKKQKT